MRCEYAKTLSRISLFLTLSLVPLSSVYPQVEDLAINLAPPNTNATMETNADDDLGDLSRIQGAFNNSKEFQNTLIYVYDKRSTYKVRCRTAMDTLIVLPENETISMFNFADSVNFKFVPIKAASDKWSNMGLIKNLNPGADTNLIIIGASGNTYNFYVRVDDTSSEFLPHLKVFIEDKSMDAKFKNPETASITNDPSVKADSSDTTPESIARKEKSSLDDEREKRDINDYLREIDNTPLKELKRNQNLDFRYAIFQKKNVIAPMSVFDDGYWTYFKMSATENLDKLPELPVVLKVVGGVERPVNTRVVRNYVIAETTGQIFALRVDDRYICIEKIIDHPNRFF